MVIAGHRNLVVAVDGGQSSTLALVATRAGHIVGVGLGGPANHIHEPGARQRLATALEAAITAALRVAQADPSDVHRTCLGLSGGAKIAAELAQPLLPHSTIRVEHDFVTALAGASLAQPGIIVIAGTGSVAYGQNGAGESARAGGWGYIMGDEGSAYDIGRAALQAVCRASDGRGPETQLGELITEQFGTSSLAIIHQQIYSGEWTRPQIAALARAVAVAAKSGDGVAQQLIANAGKELALAAIAVAQRLNFDDAIVYGTGGVFRAGEMLRKSFLQELLSQPRASKLTFEIAQFGPIVGSLLLALQDGSGAVEPQVIDAMRQTMPPEAVNKLSTETDGD